MVFSVVLIFEHTTILGFGRAQAVTQVRSVMFLTLGDPCASLNIQ
jgi:hypothetical protein